MELNKVTLDSTIGEIKRSFNDGVLDAFGEVAAALRLRQLTAVTHL